MTTPHTLPPEVTIYSVSEVKAYLLDCLQSPHTDDVAVVQLNASAVREIDGAGVQLLLALDNSLRRHDRRLVLSSAAPCVTPALQSLGAHHLLDSAELTEAGQ